jgi:hypothetical protein
MYYPYFRGKQYELVTIRESASLFAQAGFVPIIEPVREQTSGLRKALEALRDHGASSILIVNPQIGDHSDDGTELLAFINEQCEDHCHMQVGVLLTEGMDKDMAITECERIDENRSIALVHAGFSDARALGRCISDELSRVSTNIFLENYCGKLYQRHFRKHGVPVLIRDGCVDRKRNRDHPDLPEFFSDLHITFEEEGVKGFGDFLTVGDDYTEGGGPAYTVALHLTFIDSESDDEMHIQHFKSDRQDTPKDPAGKFQEALNKLIEKLDNQDSKFYDTEAMQEFRDLHERGHFPGLGYVKKLSMKHHVETLARYRDSREGNE